MYQLILNGCELWYGTLIEINAIVKSMIKRLEKNDFIEDNHEHLKNLGLLYVRTAGNPLPNNRHLEIQDKLKSKKQELHKR